MKENRFWPLKLILNSQQSKETFSKNEDFVFTETLSSWVSKPQYRAIISLYLIQRLSFFSSIVYNDSSNSNLFGIENIFGSCTGLGLVKIGGIPGSCSNDSLYIFLEFFSSPAHMVNTSPRTFSGYFFQGAYLVVW